MENLPISVTHSYANDGIDLYNGDITIINEKENISCVGRIVYKWLPKPLIQLDAQMKDENGKNAYLHFPNPIGEIITGNNSTQVFRIKSHGLNYFEAELPFYKEGDLEIKCDTILFSIPNIMGMENEILVLRTDKFEIKIQRNNSIKKRYSGDGGFILYGVGQLKFLNSNKNLNEAKEIIELLGLFLTFLHGHIVVPLFFQGLIKNSVQWKYCPVKQIDEMALPWTWFTPTLRPKDHPIVSDLWMKLWKLYQVEEDKECIQLLMHLYTESTTHVGSLETSIMLIQNALELLSSRILVEQEKIVDRNDYDKMSASTLINVLLNWANIDNSIPASYSAMIALAKEHNLYAGPSVITYVRNCIVHPHLKNRKKYKNLSSALKFQAFQLATHYTELIMLKYFNYNGLYYNRCFDGNEMDKRMLVPWMKNTN